MSSASKPVVKFSVEDYGDFTSPVMKWGTQYNVILDTNADNVLDVNQVYSDFNDAEKPRGIPAAAFALGTDQKVGTNGDGRFRNGNSASDDVLSWR